MQRGMNGLAMQMPQALKRDSRVSDLKVFCGRRGNLLNVVGYN
ncbi:hypothetical protein JMJ56_31845 [Belnapia sp. T18]|uniref:Uncharacterized protein n=2 Tax=Belnapia arida TaxID=2804533 RepID=A0ABS1UDH2_9PROT|nr:hypothetical protein [Belnapia arida]